ncbi:uncharacterized protein B0T15DRAFT_569262 [Chaetomium strumarium]|uniref:Uncharacterized protein n=1 Tax=Chaetomium strumarium TaxID=1170767 RepID=A0AAJ0GPM6_9PEZI|nr:hypothetical protein B0T15DRAFT_569262 [Chaetomium strumarium]
MSRLVADEGDFEPPPASQSHFARFKNFTPNDEASFDEEFARLAAPRSTHLTEEELELKGYQDLCREVGIEPSESVAECKRLLKTKLVNIIDLIDARRNGNEVKVWDDFDAFRDYTLNDDEKRIDIEEAKGTHLESLLQRLITGPCSRRKRRAKRRGRGKGVASGRINKQRAP